MDSQGCSGRPIAIHPALLYSLNPEKYDASSPRWAEYLEKRQFTAVK